MPTHPFTREIEIATADQIEIILDRLASQIIEAHPKLQEVALVGIYTAGVPLSDRLRRKLKEKTGITVPSGMIDITLYRDDALEGLPSPVVGETRFDFAVDGSRIILVDDVLFTGRTIRAALDAVVDFGRPRVIELLVFADRGHREFPIQANYVGVTVQTDRKDSVKLSLPEVNAGDEVLRHFKP